MTVDVCHTEGCSKEASLQCPTCVKLEIAGSYFCSQACFKGSWEAHKAVHKKKRDAAYNPWPNFHFTGSLRPGRVGPRRSVPEAIPRPDYAEHPEGRSLSEEAARGKPIQILSDEDLEQMRVVCKLAREVLNEGAAAVAVGVPTDEIDRIVHEAAIERETYPSPLGYYGFPKSVCTSVNEVICHGIPDSRPLVDGDLCNIDVTVYHRGFHGDLNETLLVGNVSDADVALVQNAHQCLQSAIDIVRPGTKFRELGSVIQKTASAANFSVVRSFCGHGIHRLFHTAPNVPHYANNKAMGVMKPGMVFTIEPMINAGVWQDERWPDDWTAVTRDGKRSAQFEQTMVVTDNGVEVLTARSPNRPHFHDQMEAMGRSLPTL